MDRRARYRDHVDPEYQHWGRRYARFPGVAECARLIRAGKARGAWADIIVLELSENAAACLTEMIQTFRNETSGDVRIYIMMALEIARVPASVPFLAEVLREADPSYIPYAERALRGIDTTEARTALRNAATLNAPSAE